MKKSLLILAFAGTMTLSQSAFALTVYDPTNHTENLATKLNTVEMLQKQALQIQHELSNLAKLDPAMSNETTAKSVIILTSLMKYATALMPLAQTTKS